MGARRRIVVGYDASPAAQAALAWAANTARVQDADLDVRIVMSAMDPVLSHHHALAGLAANRRMAHAVRALDELGMQDARIAVVQGPTFPTLLRDIGEEDTLVLGSDGHGLISGAAHGSVSQHVARHARGPVVVVRATEDLEARRIVVGFDGSPPSLEALHWAADRAEATGEELLVLTVLAARHAQRPGTLPQGEKEQAGHAVATLRLRRELGKVLRDHPGIHARAEIRTGPVEELLVSYSAQASLLVLGAKPRDPLVEAVLGSTAQHALTHALCPVTLLHEGRKTGGRSPAISASQDGHP